MYRKRIYYRFSDGLIIKKLEPYVVLNYQNVLKKVRNYLNLYLHHLQKQI